MRTDGRSGEERNRRGREWRRQERRGNERKESRGQETREDMSVGERRGKYGRGNISLLLSRSKQITKTNHSSSKCSNGHSIQTQHILL